jgi:hypothetical protein
MLQASESIRRRCEFRTNADAQLAARSCRDAGLSRVSASLVMSAADSLAPAVLRRVDSENPASSGDTHFAIAVDE